MRRAAALVLALAAAAPPTGARAQERGAPASPLAFWQTLGDPTLERLIGRALDANPDVRAVRARVGEARAMRTAAALDLTPSVTASAAYSRQRFAAAAFPGAGGGSPSDLDVWEAGVQLGWELDVFGRLRGSLDGQNALLDAAEEDLRGVRVLLAAEVAAAYFDLRGAQDRLAVARRNAENQRSTLRLTQDRLELGRGSALDTERAQAQLSSTLATIPALEAALAAAAHRLAVLLGQDPQASLPELDLEAAPPSLPELRIADPGAVARRRPDVRAALHRRDAGAAFVGAARADYLPRISVGAAVGYTANAFDALGDSGTPRYVVGPVVSWPLLDLGRVKTRVDAARAGAAEAEARYERTRLAALEEIETSLAAYTHTRARLHHLEEAAAASERATELARLRFEEGATDFLEVLDAERRMLEAQDRLAAGRTEAAGWLVAVYRALGGEPAGSEPGGQDRRDDE